MTKTILIIDDEQDIRAYLSALLADEGYETLVAEDGFEGFELARQHKPDLISLDLMMPNKSGTDFYRRLSRDKDIGDTPVIVVSGVAGRDLAVKQPAASFDKPINAGAFLRAVREALQ